MKIKHLLLNCSGKERRHNTHNYIRLILVDCTCYSEVNIRGLLLVGDLRADYQLNTLSQSTSSSRLSAAFVRSRRCVGLFSLHSLCWLTWSDTRNICRMIKPDNWWIFFVCVCVCVCEGSHTESELMKINTAAGPMDLVSETINHTTA